MSAGHGGRSHGGKDAITGPLTPTGEGMCTVDSGLVCWGRRVDRDATAADKNSCSPKGCSRTTAARGT